MWPEHSNKPDLCVLCFKGHKVNACHTPALQRWRGRAGVVQQSDEVEQMLSNFHEEVICLCCRTGLNVHFKGLCATLKGKC